MLYTLQNFTTPFKQMDACDYVFARKVWAMPQHCELTHKIDLREVLDE